MDITIIINEEGQILKYNINNKKFEIMIFIVNALNEGWSVKKKNDAYVFSKNHEGKKEIFSENYITKFVKENLDINKILC
jgi:hypothetical protein